MDKLKYAGIGTQRTYSPMESAAIPPFNGIAINMVVTLVATLSKRGVGFIATVSLLSNDTELVIINSSDIYALTMELNSDRELRMKLNQLKLHYEVDTLYLYYNGLEILNKASNPYYKMHRDDTELFSETMMDIASKSTLLEFDLYY